MDDVTGRRRVFELMKVNDTLESNGKRHLSNRKRVLILPNFTLSFLSHYLHLLEEWVPLLVFLGDFQRYNFRNFENWEKKRKETNSRTLIPF